MYFCQSNAVNDLSSVSEQLLPTAILFNLTDLFFYFLCFFLPMAIVLSGLVPDLAKCNYPTLKQAENNVVFHVSLPLSFIVCLIIQSNFHTCMFPYSSAMWIR